MELDHDDLLLPDALASVVAARWRHPDVRFVYSDFAEMASDGGRRDVRFDAEHGWRYSDLPMGDGAMDRCHAMAPLPHNVSLIWYAPNHLRAFTRQLYDEVGGYDSALAVLDDQDLMCRMFERTAFGHIDRCLYLQRRHPANSQSEASLNRLIQDQTTVLAGRWIKRLTLAWAAREGLAMMDVTSDDHPLHIDADTDSVGMVRVMGGATAGRARADDLDEIHRVLAHGGLAQLRGGGWGSAAALIQQRFQMAGRPALVTGAWRDPDTSPWTHLVAVKDGARLGGAPLRWATGHRKGRSAPL